MSVFPGIGRSLGRDRRGERLLGLVAGRRAARRPGRAARRPGRAPPQRYTRCREHCPEAGPAVRERELTVRRSSCNPARPWCARESSRTSGSSLQTERAAHAGGDAPLQAVGARQPRARRPTRPPLRIRGDDRCRRLRGRHPRRRHPRPDAVPVPGRAGSSIEGSIRHGRGRARRIRSGSALQPAQPQPAESRPRGRVVGDTLV